MVEIDTFANFNAHKVLKNSHRNKTQQIPKYNKTQKFQGFENLNLVETNIFFNIGT